jgi:hypothetical protein
MSEKLPEPKNPKVDEILLSIADDFRRALEAERTFVEWERAHRGAEFDEFSKKFVEWTDAIEPYVRKFHTIEEHFPVFSDKMHAVLTSVSREFAS